MFDEASAYNVTAIVVWALLQGGIVHRLVSAMWRRSLGWELAAGAGVMLASYGITTSNHASPTSLALLALALVLNAAGVVIGRRILPPIKPARL